MAQTLQIMHTTFDSFTAAAAARSDVGFGGEGRPGGTSVHLWRLVYPAPPIINRIFIPSSLKDKIKKVHSMSKQLAKQLFALTSRGRPSLGYMQGRRPDDGDLSVVDFVSVVPEASD